MAKADTLHHELQAMRESLGFSQETMAAHIGLSTKQYHMVEKGLATCRQIHILAAERVVLEESRKRKDPKLLTRSLKQDIEIIARLPLWS